MILTISGKYDRPNRITTTNKDEKYHADYGKYCISTGYDCVLHADFLRKTYINKSFYMGNQWLFSEDLEAFFKDDSDQVRNRIKIGKNIIRPILEQFRGNALRMVINASIKSISPNVVNRREEQLSEYLHYTDLANEMPEFGDFLRSKLPIGKTRGETEQIFENLWVDEYVDAMNSLLGYSARINKFQQRQLKIAENMALSGMGVLFHEPRGGEYIFEPVESEEYYWDRSALEYDHSDADFWGRIKFMTPTEIFELNQNLNDSQRASIEKYSMDSIGSVDKRSNRTTLNGRVPVWFNYWRDGETYEYGYVDDGFGYALLTKINHVFEGEEQPRYTDKDLIPYDKLTPHQKKVLKYQPKTKLYVDVLRFCVIIPEIGEKIEGQERQSDIVLSYGILPYQETDNFAPSNVRPPFNVHCWGYIDGQVMSPVDDAIDPQRFINRLMSVAENQINNSHGATTFYDNDMVDQEEGEDGLMRNMYQGKPVGLSSRGRGIQNSVWESAGTSHQGTMTMFNVMSVIQSHVQETSGVNEPLQGQSMGSDQLVGVTQLLIQRGSLMQEPFYNAVTQVFLSAYQTVATVAKRFYIDSERQLAIIVGDKGVKVFKLSKDMKLEDFRAFVTRENADEVLKQSANNMLLTFYQLGLLDKKRLAVLWNRSTPDEVARALRESDSEATEAARIKAEQDAQQNAVIQQAMDKEMQRQNAEKDRLEALAAAESEKNRQNEIDKIMTKGIVDIAKQREQQKGQLQQKNQKNFAMSKN